jgi:hypothetical protein
MSLQVTEAKILQKTIQGLVSYAPAALLNTEGKVKAYWKRVPDNISSPYVVYSRMPSGGLSRSPHNRDSNSLWRIVTTTANWEDVGIYATFMGRLDRLMPDVSTASNVRAAVSYIEEILPIEETIQPQNNTVFEVGGIYSLRLDFGSNQP